MQFRFGSGGAVTTVAVKYLTGRFSLPFRKARVDGHKSAAASDVLLIIIGIPAFDVVIRQHPCDRAACRTDCGANAGCRWDSRGCDRARRCERAHARNGESSYAQDCASNAAASNCPHHATLAGTVMIIISAAHRVFIRSPDQRNGIVLNTGISQFGNSALCLRAIIENRRYYVLAHVIAPVLPL